jgi:protoporphyrinogen oxidase
MSYDLIIVGAGIAGLYTGLYYIKKHPKHKVIILEKYDYIGGRIVTYSKPPYQWEIGAGRIASNHYKVKKLMDTYGLTWVPISSDSSWLDGPGAKIESNPFNKLIPVLMSPLASLPSHILATHTLAQLLKVIHGSTIANTFIKQFPYWAEVNTLRADLALQSFSEEMGSKATFGVCVEGLQAIVSHMANEFIKLGGIIQLKTTVKNIIKQTVILKDNNRLSGKNIVLALHASALKQIPSLATWKPLKYLAMEPLVRIYAVFPTGSGSSGVWFHSESNLTKNGMPNTSSGVWFSDLGKIVTKNKIRYIIPIDPKKGSIMISYTDGADAKYWISRYNKGGQKEVQEEVMNEIRKLFPTRFIPDPILFKVYPWTEGCTYWLPGKYDPIEMSKAAHCIRSGLYCCGESISLRQAWMEGALESAEEVCKLVL